MLSLALNTSGGMPLRILCLGAHADDVEIGCGGTLLTLVQSHPNVSVHWIVFSASEARAIEARRSAARFLEGAHSTIEVKAFRDGFFPYVGADIKECFEGLKPRFSPDLIFTHYRDDRHQDHRVISDLTWNTFRNHLILEYEIPKYDGDLGVPNCFVGLEPAVCRRKVEWITEEFQTQQNRHWFTDETFFSLLRLRGIESGAQSGYAEAFYSRKATLNLNLGN